MTIKQPLFTRFSLPAIFLVALCCLGVQTLNAQKVKTSLYLQKYRSLFIGLGPRFLDTDPGTISTTFVDDSPSMDSFNSDFEIKDRYTQVGINFGYKFGRYRGLSHDILFDISASNNYQIIFGYSLGWNFLLDVNGKDIVVRPALQAFGSNQVFQIGQIQNNAAFIQIDDTRYFEDELNLELRAELLAISPRLDITYVFADRWDCFLKMAYDFPRENTNPRLDFSVPSNLRTDDSPTDSTVDIDGDNPLVRYNGEKLESLPYNPGGLRLTLGISFLWNR
ncbi:MAG: hypothetical protein AAFN81_05610 [Bacteroidota bacterium]